METLIQIIGWVGTFLVIVAYCLISSNRVEESNRYYQLMNFFGAIFLGINVFHQKAWPAMVVQIVWGMVAIISLLGEKSKVKN